MLENKHASSACYVCDVMHVMSTSSTSIEHYRQRYCTLLIGFVTADVTISQGHLGVKLVEFSLPMSPAVYHALS